MLGGSFFPRKEMYDVYYETKIKGENTMDREQAARSRHKSGSNCASAVYSSFSDKVTGTAPVPRSEGGKCGAVLAAEKVIREMGMDAAGFDQKFLDLFGSIKCAEHRRGKYPCNDLVGTAAKLADEIVA